MPRYHINPQTGVPNVCKAMVSCPFGDLESEHYDSKAAAQSAYEKKQGANSVPTAAKKRKSIEAQIKEKQKEERAIQSTIGKKSKERDHLAKAIGGLDSLIKALPALPFASDSDRDEEKKRLEDLRATSKVVKQAADKELDSLRRKASTVAKQVNALKAELPTTPLPPRANPQPSPWNPPGSSWVYSSKYGK